MAYKEAQDMSACHVAKASLVYHRIRRQVEVVVFYAYLGPKLPRIDLICSTGHARKKYLRCTLPGTQHQSMVKVIA